jgi:hypothetical protein
VSASIEIKKELYARVKTEVDLKQAAQVDSELKRLDRAMKRFYSREWFRVSESYLQKKISSSKLVFWGDFHGVRQFQRSVLRWLELLKPFEGKDFVLALECLPSSAQKWVDMFVNHQISEKDFLTRVKWQQTWGFPWEHYQPLFQLAQIYKFKIHVLNQPGKNPRMASREKWALKHIENLKEQKPTATIWVLYGEFHLLPQRFQKLFKRHKPLYVFQNSDLLYFKNPPKKNESGSILKLNESNFCLQSVAPWIKWQSYLYFLDTHENNEVEEGMDVSEHVAGLATALSQEFQWKFDKNSVHTFSSDDPALWQKIKSSQNESKKIFEKFVQEGISFAHRGFDWSYLSRLTANEVGSLAFMILWFQNVKSMGWPERKIWGLSDWQHVLWILSFSYFGSKVLNPHRKTPLLSELHHMSKSAAQPFERQAARIVINYLLQQNMNRLENVFESTPSDRVKFQALLWLAGLQGERIYQVYTDKRLSLMSLKSFLSKNPRMFHFQEVLRTLDEILT